MTELSFYITVNNCRDPLVIS